MFVPVQITRGRVPERRHGSAFYEHAARMTTRAFCTSVRARNGSERTEAVECIPVFYAAEAIGSENGGRGTYICFYTAGAIGSENGGRLDRPPLSSLGLAGSQLLHCAIAI